MKAINLYEQLEKDFITAEMVDEWSKYMEEVNEFLCDNFKKRSMGLVCDFTKEVNKVFTAVFPTKEVMEAILATGIKDAMLFVHHPSIWDIRKSPTFYQMDKNLLNKFKENRISIYNLHTPLDSYSEYSTSKTLADALDIEIEKPFAHYYGTLSGVIGKTKYKTINELQNAFSKVLGHDSKLYPYGESIIKDGRVAIIAGGGNAKNFISEILDANINTFVTGITAYNNHSKETHDFEKENKINILGGSHYSTEKFACERICDYFEKLGIPATFIAGEPTLEDM